MRLHEQARALSASTTTSTALVEAALGRIASDDGDLGAFLAVDDAGARAAAAASDERRRQGRPLSAFDGVPVALKDNLCFTGLPTTAGSKILGGWRPPAHAACVQRLLDRGAIVVGKTNLDEFGMGSATEHSAFFCTKNPWDRARTPGGSSGGAAAAVAAGFVAAGLGTDTGGSVRQPAAFCGVVGVKPTYGRVSRRGVVAFASSLDQVGVVASDVDGAAAVLEAICGKDDGDATSVDVAVSGFVGGGSDVAGLRIGVPRRLLGSLDDVIAGALAGAEGGLEDRGAVVVDVDLDAAEFAVAAYYVVAMAEASSNLARYDGVRFGPRRGHGGLDSLYEETRALFGREVRRRLLRGAFVLSAGFYDAYVEQAQKVRTLIARGFSRAFSTCDAVLLPTTPTTAWRRGEKGDPLAMYQADLFTLPASLAGLPALSVPVASSSSLPVGLQLVGRAFDEATILRLARALFHPFSGDKR
jgi:aspartyl-tRNA(Asn)/glutamyl-tRNA(Gln) amidotransferase subunit A